MAKPKQEKSQPATQLDPTAMASTTASTNGTAVPPPASVPASTDADDVTREASPASGPAVDPPATGGDAGSVPGDTVAGTDAAGEDRSTPVHLERIGIVTARESIEVHSGYCTRHIDCKLSPRQAAAAKMGAALLSDRGDRFEGGRSSHPAGTVVDNAADFMRWLLDRAADDFEQATGKSLVADFDLQFR